MLGMFNSFGASTWSMRVCVGHTDQAKAVFEPINCEGRPIGIAIVGRVEIILVAPAAR